MKHINFIVVRLRFWTNLPNTEKTQILKHVTFLHNPTLLDRVKALKDWIAAGTPNGTEVTFMSTVHLLVTLLLSPHV